MSARIARGRLTAVCMVVIVIGVCGSVEARPKVSREILKTYFEKGDRPTESQFGTLIDSTINRTDDGLVLVGIGATAGTGSTPIATRFGENKGINELLPDVVFHAAATHPEMEPEWAGQFGFLALKYIDSASEPHYGFLQIAMDSPPAPLGSGAPPQPPGINVQYWVWETAANTTLDTYIVPEPSTGGLIVAGSMALAGRRRRK